MASGSEDHTISWDGRQTSLDTDQIQMNFEESRGVMQSTPRLLEGDPLGRSDGSYVVLDQISDRADSCVVDMHSRSSSGHRSLHSAHDASTDSPARVQFSPPQTRNFPSSNQEDTQVKQ